MLLSSNHNKRFYGETKNGEVLLMSTHNMLLWRNKKNNIYVAMPYIWSIAFFHTLISLHIVMTDVTICIWYKHYENMPIQIYWNFNTKKWKLSDKKFWYSSYFCSSHRLWVLVRTASARRFNKYSQSMFLSRNKETNVYPCNPKFYYIKVGFKGVSIVKVCFCDEVLFSHIIFGSLFW